MLGVQFERDEPSPRPGWPVLATVLGLGALIVGAGALILTRRGA